MKFHLDMKNNGHAICGAVANRPHTFVYKKVEFTSHLAAEYRCKKCEQILNKSKECQCPSYERIVNQDKHNTVADAINLLTTIN